ncbi:hypothetical protein LPJ72_004898 [Coemansia sp. Benny D160-2]|nr:hypothetical protein LPJ72_004898 [Coemansia sp. Benny D160-2]
MSDTVAGSVDQQTDEIVLIGQQNRGTNSDPANATEEPAAKAQNDGAEADGELSSDLDSSSEESSSSDDDDDRGGRNLLRLIEEAEAEDDDDEMMGMAGESAGPATRNEQVDPQIARPTIDVIPAAATLRELGVIQAVVGPSVIIRAHHSPDNQAQNQNQMVVVDCESVVALGNRRVLGLVFDVFGPVTQPMYTVRFPTPEDIDPTECAPGTAVYYSPELARIVDTGAIRRAKGTDASNEYDEEAGSDAMEFSDDEAEMQHRRLKKNKKTKTAAKAPPPPPPPPSSQQQPGTSTGVSSLPPPVAGRSVQSYQDLYDPDLGF